MTTVILAPGGRGPPGLRQGGQVRERKGQDEPWYAGGRVLLWREGAVINGVE